MGIFKKKSKPKAYYISDGRGSFKIGFVTYDGKNSDYCDDGSIRWISLVDINGKNIFNWPGFELKADPISDIKYKEIMEDLPNIIYRIHNDTGTKLSEGEVDCRVYDLHSKILYRN